MDQKDGLFDCSSLNSRSVGGMKYGNILTCQFPFDERKKCKRSNHKVYSADSVLATEFLQISEIVNMVWEKGW